MEQALCPLEVDVSSEKGVQINDINDNIDPNDVMELKINNKKQQKKSLLLLLFVLFCSI